MQKWKKIYKIVETKKSYFSMLRIRVHVNIIIIMINDKAT